MKKIMCFFAVLALSICLIQTSYAHESTKKLARGIVNCATGWVELPKNIYETSVEDNIFLGLTVGIAKGIANGVLRTGAGIYDVVTFPFPIPEEYAPIWEPEFVFSEDSGASVGGPSK